MALTQVQSGMMDSIAQYNSFKNRIINGGMRIDQRNAGAAVTINSTANTYTVDRWAAAGQLTDGVYTAQRSTTAPSGFTNSLLATVTTADSSIGSTQSYLLTQFIEGLNASDLAWGTASAAPVTLSFWVRSSLTGTFGGCLQNSANDRSYPFSFTINSANTYEQKSITIAGDTTGTWLTDTGRGINVRFSLGVGSSYKTTSGAWAAGNYFAPTGSVDFISTLSATFYVTGVQLEKGSTATAFDYRPYTTELQLCQRYYEKSCAIETAPTAGMAYDNNGSYVTANAFGTTNARTNSLYFKVQKRASPTVTIYRTNIVASNDNSIAYFNSGGAWVNYATAATMSTSQWGFAADFTTSGTSWGQALMTIFGWAATAEL